MTIIALLFHNKHRITTTLGSACSSTCFPVLYVCCFLFFFYIYFWHQSLLWHATQSTQENLSHCGHLIFITLGLFLLLCLVFGEIHTKLLLHCSNFATDLCFELLCRVCVSLPFFRHKVLTGLSNETEEKRAITIKSKIIQEVEEKWKCHGRR